MSVERWSDPEAVLGAVAVLGHRARLNAPLGALTTSRVGGPAAVAYTANSPSDMQLVREAASVSGLATLVVGRGSNLLVADRGFEGIALFLGEAYSQIEIDETQATVKAGAAAALPVLARQCAAAGIGGLEWAVGVPGSVGGAVRMNAGGHGSDIASCLIDADVVDLAAKPISEAAKPISEAAKPISEVAKPISEAAKPISTAEASKAKSADAQALALGYRSSGLQPHQVVVGARLFGRRTSPSTAMDRIADIVRWRREHQPGGQNCGSVFVNPPTQSAGACIDRAGLRGLRIGTAEVSRRHGNFIVSDPDGAAADVATLIAEIRRIIGEESGILLQPEVRMVGFEVAPASS